MWEKQWPSETMHRPFTRHYVYENEYMEEKRCTENGRFRVIIVDIWKRMQKRKTMFEFQ